MINAIMKSTFLGIVKLLPVIISLKIPQRIKTKKLIKTKLFGMFKKLESKKDLVNHQVKMY